MRGFGGGGYVFAAGFVWYVGGSLRGQWEGGDLAFGHVFFSFLFFLSF